MWPTEQLTNWLTDLQLSQIRIAGFHKPIAIQSLYHIIYPCIVSFWLCYFQLFNFITFVSGPVLILLYFWIPLGIEYLYFNYAIWRGVCLWIWLTAIVIVLEMLWTLLLLWTGPLVELNLIWIPHFIRPSEVVDWSD